MKGDSQEYLVKESHNHGEFGEKSRHLLNNANLKKIPCWGFSEVVYCPNRKLLNGQR